MKDDEMNPTVLPKRIPARECVWEARHFLWIGVLQGKARVINQTNIRINKSRTRLLMGKDFVRAAGVLLTLFLPALACFCQPAHAATTPATPPAVQPAGPQAGVPAPPPEPEIYIREYRVQGVHMLTNLEVEQAVYPFLGPGRTRNDVE